MEINWPKISVITPVFNAVNYIEASIESVLAQNYPNLEYIIIDGGSTDGTLDIIKKYHTNLSYWESKPDRGQTHALNKGFKLATGDLRAWLNADEEYLPGTLTRLGQEYMADEDLDLIYGGRYILDLTVSPPLKVLQKMPPFDPFDLMFYTGRLLFSDATFWTKRMHDDLGELNETDYPKLAMDVEWLLRVVGKTKKWKHLAVPLSIYKTHGMNATTQGVEQGIRLNEKIRREYAKKNRISTIRLVFGWFWYSAKLRVWEKGINGLFIIPRWNTIEYLFFKKYGQNTHKTAP